MPRTAQDVTDAELALMRQLWDHGAATIRQLTDGLYPGGGASQYATVQKLLERLEDKGYVRRDRRSNVHVFEPAVGRDDLIGRRLQTIAEKLCGGSLTPLLTHLVRAKSLSASDRQSLRKLINELDGPDKPRGRR
jgi:BlaI family transcriptional regulator, penicillinase repressor